ncbi:MAG: 3-deoxy-8-phosphooctulonate synthase [Planctomycetota bacterium]|nr:3-deoxy-8-phosphooctulonate synthase [Planctomycetota bacterium]
MSRISEVAVGPVSIGEGRPLALLAGPCVIESERHTIRLAEAIREICARLNFPFIFKASFDKANRSSIESYRGPGLDEGLRILAKTRDAIDGPVLTDIHEASQAQPVGEALDLIQIPAFLCRQTDLLAAAAKTGKPVNVKKGQFLSPEEMKNVVDKIKANGNEQVLLTERGTFFGYNRLVNDMTAIPRMRALAPVVFDATHSCQMPGGLGFQSGGNREYAATLAQAAVAAGADAIFIEVHDDPDNAMSDPATVWPLDQLEALLRKCQAIRAACGTG